MAAPVASLYRCCQRSSLLLVARRLWSSSPASLPEPPPSPPRLLSRLLLFLSQRFYDVEMFLNWRSQLSRDQLRKKNAYYGYTEKLYGSNIASAYFVLSLGGGFKFAGQSDWFYANKKGKFNWDFLNYKDSLIEEVDMSGTIINYTGLSNLEDQKLQTLKLRGCREVDDWFLARLHVFQDSLQELDISHCPQISTGGLAALRNLRGLKRLNVSSLLRISSPGLVIILLEEMLPHCQITADGYDHSIIQAEEDSADMRTKRQR